MSYLYLLLIIMGCALQDVFKKAFAEKNNGEGSYAFSLLTACSAMLFFFITGKDFSWDWQVVPYSCLFAAAYASAIIFSVFAMAHGPMSLTALIVSYSLLLPAGYGLVFLKEPVSAALVCGLVLLAVSLFLINKTTVETKPNMKWGLYVSIAFAGNGMCSTMQKIQQNAFDGAYKNEFMIIALGITSVAMCIMLVCQKKATVRSVKSGWYFGAACGLMNGMTNFWVMIVMGKLSMSVVYPVISAGGIITTYFLAKFLYKEKLSKLQSLGLVLGIAAVILFNV